MESRLEFVGGEHRRSGECEFLQTILRARMGVNRNSVFVLFNLLSIDWFDIDAEIPDPLEGIRDSLNDLLPDVTSSVLMPFNISCCVRQYFRTDPRSFRHITAAQTSVAGVNGGHMDRDLPFALDGTTSAYRGVTPRSWASRLVLGVRKYACNQDQHTKPVLHDAAL